MKLLTEIDVGGHTITKTDNSNWKLNLTINSKELGGSGDTGQCTNVSWANHLLETLVRNSTGSPKALSEMPSATSSGSHIPSNEDCGIRDVWCHNLEEEFRTIRQVSIYIFIM